MFVVLDGQAGLSCVGCQYPLCTYSPGEAFGEIDAMQGRPRSSATTAVTACRLIVVPSRPSKPLVASATERACSGVDSASFPGMLGPSVG